MNKVAMFLLTAMLLSLNGQAAAIAEAPVSQCQTYSIDIGLGLSRGGFQPVTTCSSTPTTNEAEFLFSLTLADNRRVEMTCNPIECSVPVAATTTPTE